MAVAVAGVDPLAGAFAVAGAAHRVGLRGQQRVDERRQQVPHQVRARLIQLLGEELGRVDTGSSGHRRVLLRVGCERSLEASTRWPRLRRRHALTQVRRTPLCWTPLPSEPSRPGTTRPGRPAGTHPAPLSRNTPPTPRSESASRAARRGISTATLIGSSVERGGPLQRRPRGAACRREHRLDLTDVTREIGRAHV